MYNDVDEFFQTIHKFVDEQHEIKKAEVEEIF
jgi:hypothetical protein